MRRAAILLLTGLLVSACQRQPVTVDPAPNAVPAVVATIFPLADITATLAGDSAAVVTLVPAGASSHTFELTPSQARAISDAVLVVRVGPGADDWLDQALGSSSAEVVTLLDHTETIAGGHDDEHAGHDEGEANPHVWLDPVRMRDDLAPAIAEGLGAALPFEARSINERLAELQGKLTALDESIAEQLRDLPSKRYIGVHPAWAYFDQRYGLEMAAAIQQVAGAEPSAKWLRHVVDVARESDVRAVFTEVQMSDRLAKSLQSETDIRVGGLDPLGGSDVPDRDGYEALMTYNAARFREVLAP